MTRLLAEGIELFNSGEYWHSHEVWEREWTPDRKGPDSGFYKGLIQVAAGCLHYTRHNRRGTVNKWRSGANYLRPYLPVHNGVRLAPLVVGHVRKPKPDEFNEMHDGIVRSRPCDTCYRNVAPRHGTKKGRHRPAFLLMLARKLGGCGG